MGKSGKKPAFSPEEMLNISTNLRTLRIKSGYTLEQLSVKIGLPFSTLAMYESGWANISWIRLRKMAEFYRVKPERLVENWDEK